MTFGDALEHAKAGKVLRRQGWLKGDRLICNYTKDMQPFLEVSDEDKEPIAYFASNIDIFADDWDVVNAS